MKVGALQFYPMFKKPEENIDKANQLLMGVQHLDFLVLPEMAFCGYMFESREDVRPYVEKVGTGITSMWAIETSERLGCVLSVGFALEDATDGKYYNAVILANKGKIVGVYRKHFLYETDEHWAKEGPSFQTFDVDGMKVGVGICMDVNPYKFRADFEEYEFATFQLENKADIVLLSMNWLTHENCPRITDRNTCYIQQQYQQQVNAKLSPVDTNEMQWARQNINYWLLRLQKMRNAGVVIANRTGVEKETIFCGNSCIFTITSEIRICGFMGRTEEGVLQGEFPFPPE